jgi:hypothetical protein
MRAALRLRDRKYLDVIKLAITCWRPQAWRYAMKWAKNKRHPGASPLVERQEIWP